LSTIDNTQGAIKDRSTILIGESDHLDKSLKQNSTSIV
jgi:hypothetical protein